MTLANAAFRIQGVLAADGTNDNTVVVPLPVARAQGLGAPGGNLDQSVIKTSSPDSVSRAAYQVAAILDRQHGIHSAADRDFSVKTFSTTLGETRRYIAGLSWLAVGLGALTLLVSGIGVANLAASAVPGPRGRRSRALVLAGPWRAEPLAERLAGCSGWCRPKPAAHAAPAAGRTAHPAFPDHLLGRIAWVATGSPSRAARLRSLFDAIDWGS